MSRQMKVALNLLTSVENPSSAIAGDVYFNVVTKNLRIYNGMDWVELTPPSTDPTPFYMHTHTYDGEVHTIDIDNPIRFNELTGNGVQPTLPLVIGVDGGSPSSNISDPSLNDLTLFDSGEL